MPNNICDDCNRDMPVLRPHDVLRAGEGKKTLLLCDDCLALIPDPPKTVDKLSTEKIAELRHRLRTLEIAMDDADKRIATNPDDTKYVSTQQDKKTEWEKERQSILTTLNEQDKEGNLIEAAVKRSTAKKTVRDLFLTSHLEITDCIDLIIELNGYVGVGIISLGNNLKNYCYDKSSSRGR